VNNVPQSRLTNAVVRTDSRPRTKVTAGLIALAAIVCLARLLQWQVIERDRLLAAAASQSSASIVQSPPRGTITDSSGVVVLATTVMRYRLTALPGRMAASERPAVAARLAELIGGEAGDSERIRALLESGRTRVTIHPGVDDAAAERIQSAVSSGELTGLSLEQVRLRSYPQPGGSPGTSLASQVLGFVNSDGLGQYGVEGYYDEALAGSARVTDVSRDTSGNLSTVEVAAGHPGVDLQLCIDARIQSMVEQEIAVAGVADLADSVSMVVMDPYTGAVIASASWPSFDGNSYGVTAARDPSRFMDPVISSVYEPGSVMKALTATAALEEGVASPSTIYNDERVLYLDDGVTRVRNSDLKSRGPISMTEALAYSRNIVFSKVALSLGDTTTAAANRLYATWLRFGVGGRTGVDLAGENQGIVRDPSETRWRQIDLANASFGQGVGVTLMQLATFYSSLVNGGVLVRPRVVAAVNGVPTPITVRGTATTPAVSRQMIQMTSSVLQIAPFYRQAAAIPSFVYGGKTGTAQIWMPDAKNGVGAYDQEHFNFTFIGWFGRTAPEYVIATTIHHATPKHMAVGWWQNKIESWELFRRVAQDIISVYGITPAAVSDSRSTSPAHPGSPGPSAPVAPAVGGVSLPTRREARGG